MDGLNLGDVISLIIVFSLYLIAASGKTKKGKRGSESRQRRSPMRTRAQGERADRGPQERDRQTHAGFGNAFAETSVQEDRHFCDVKQMHLHEVSQQQFEQASEGEDPCHAGGAQFIDDQPFDLQRNLSNESLAQDMLRGVVMSEILMRPSQRAALRRGGR